MQKMVEVKKVSPKIITMDIVIDEEIFTVISVYCPQRGKSDEDKDAFYDELCDVVMSKKRKCFVMGDFNRHVGCSSNGYFEVHGGFGYGERNREGERLLELADSLDMIIGDTFFKKDHEKLISCKSDGHATVVDYILMEKGDLKMIKDVKIIPGEECFAQHRLLVMHMKWSKVVKEEASMLKRQVNSGN